MGVTRGEEWECRRGEKIHLRLLYRSSKGYDHVWMDFDGPSGHRVRLDGNTRTKPSYAEAFVEGEVGEGIELGVYRCETAQGRIRGDYEPFLHIDAAIRVVEEPSGSIPSKLISIERVE